MIRVSAGQSLLDICLQELGDAEALFELAAANGLAITDPLTPGQLLILPAGAVVNSELVAYYRARNLRLNTANLPPLPEPEPESLVDWDETDFDNDDWF